MTLIDLLYGRSHNSAKGKIHLRNRSGEPVTITKEIRYTGSDGYSNSPCTGYDDVLESCRSAEYTYRSGKTV